MLLITPLIFCYDSLKRVLWQINVKSDTDVNTVLNGNLKASGIRHT